MLGVIIVIKHARACLSAELHRAKGDRVVFALQQACVRYVRCIRAGRVRIRRLNDASLCRCRATVGSSSHSKSIGDGVGGQTRYPARPHRRSGTRGGGHRPARRRCRGWPPCDQLATRPGETAGELSGSGGVVNPDSRVKGRVSPASSVTTKTSAAAEQLRRAPTVERPASRQAETGVR